MAGGSFGLFCFAGVVADYRREMQEKRFRMEACNVTLTLLEDWACILGLMLSLESLAWAAVMTARFNRERSERLRLLERIMLQMSAGRSRKPWRDSKGERQMFKQHLRT